ncbi:3-oxoacyl-(acyl-carrier-protein) reductase [Desulfonatronospira thiodismutans ASO3-1]|uniref:3-oxoacyl-[acyl-carrier-protein] reductase n=1 Tax=Desulfonatronospira thiodismutans ASO3-1 TaxID=555779 RepID=D6SQR7_9BACT|nr:MULTISPECIES: 3-oxoacyl-[acyl-carrier-protein] reductase [Desulfonatronospira]EFI35093.1 3-oxoacyl-(acyl-carrier-protein) reductase [Desulfonatronospira thiodismutans ASO3-1]RQD73530.1 MAG: 3-oxoacyl-[acyl-carrier-protein] reductase [Desulfonatronospira sp. MSAO_Bac3]
MSELLKTALVTGGSRGIGRECALRLARDGYNVYITYVSKPQQARETCTEIENLGVQAASFELDVGDQEAIVDFFKNEIKDRVDLQVLVNNAGLTQDGLLVRMKPEQWEKVIRVNLTGSFICLQQAAKIMMRNRRGRIINLSSVTAQTGNPGQANYTSAKAGLIGLTKTAAQELAPRNITVNAVAPGFIDTDMTDKLPGDVRDRFLQMIPLQRFGTPGDVAECVAFLASGEAGYITGQVLGINGGLYM